MLSYLLWLALNRQKTGPYSYNLPKKIIDFFVNAYLATFASQQASEGGSIDPSSAQVVPDVGDVQPVINGDYVSGTSTAQSARDANLGFDNQLQGILSGENVKIIQDMQAAAAKSQYDYLERMSSTAYQRSVEDMKRAGLNPAVMFSGGSGSAASTPQAGISSVYAENQLVSLIPSALQAFGNLAKAYSSLAGLMSKSSK